jgi:tRNA dimethylallyltransferase
VALGGIASRGRPAIVVGGTGLYLRALLSGLAEAPGADPAFREALGREAARDGTAALHARLARIDPETARRVHPNDLVRIERALEIHHATGRPASELRSAHGFRGVGPRAVTCVLDLPDGVLRSNIALRADAMLRAGLVDEVRRLGEMGFGPDLKPMKALNYRHAWMHLRGEIALNDLPERMVADTWHFARRQRRWFRAEPGAELVPPDLGAILSRLGLPAR